MKKKRRILRDCRGEMSYISSVVSITVLLLFVVLILNVFSVLTLRENMQYVVDRTLEKLAADGSTQNAVLYFEAACEEVGIVSVYNANPPEGKASNEADFDLDGTQYTDDGLFNEVPYGEAICLTMTCKVPFMGGGALFPSMTIDVKGSRLSEVFRK